MADVPGGGLEQAITWLNMADAAVAGDGMEKSEVRVRYYLDRAAALLTDPAIPRDGYYAFVCEKCAPVFSYYGYFRMAGQLREAAQVIYQADG